MGHGPSLFVRACLQTQLAWLYLGSMLHKDFGAYFVDAHAARSMLLVEQHDTRDSILWQLAVRFASYPPGARALSRFAYLAEVATGVAAACVALATWAAIAHPVLCQ